MSAIGLNLIETFDLHAKSFVPPEISKNVLPKFLDTIKHEASDQNRTQLPGYRFPRKYLPGRLGKQRDSRFDLARWR